jgi:hypothetical protein
MGGLLLQTSFCFRVLHLDLKVRVVNFFQVL